MFNKYPFFEIIEKVSIDKIKINRKLFSFDNPVNFEEVQYMVKNFELNAWIPITVNEKFYLLDGQHRLECARKKKLKFIDVVVCKTNLMNLKDGNQYVSK